MSILATPYERITLGLHSSIPVVAVSAEELLDPEEIALFWPSDDDETYEDYLKTLSLTLPISHQDKPWDQRQRSHDNGNCKNNVSVFNSFLSKLGFVKRQATPQCFPPVLNDVAAALACAMYLFQVADHGCGVKEVSSIELCSALVSWAIPKPLADPNSPGTEGSSCTSHRDSPRASEMTVTQAYHIVYRTGPDPTNATEYRPRGATVLGRSRNGKQISTSCADVAAAVFWVARECKLCNVNEQPWCSAAGVASARDHEDFLIQTDVYMGSGGGPVGSEEYIIIDWVG